MMVHPLVTTTTTTSLRSIFVGLLLLFSSRTLFLSALSLRRWRRLKKLDGVCLNVNSCGVNSGGLRVDNGG
ncbi:hypothetical protein F2Q69_00042795 [Brassica cretica]|uniref:Uncharacterized protein n=1 Tax=Brassica cretica TaxID=69181 RepID=A0A8S9NEN7_BRACR|nr:hypothetical protein F2Q69_00042795 [Brassica cretica]